MQVAVVLPHTHTAHTCAYNVADVSYIYVRRSPSSALLLYTSAHFVHFFRTLTASFATAHSEKGNEEEEEGEEGEEEEGRER